MQYFKSPEVFWYLLLCNFIHHHAYNLYAGAMHAFIIIQQISDISDIIPKSVVGVRLQASLVHKYAQRTPGPALQQLPNSASLLITPVPAAGRAGVPSRPGRQGPVADWRKLCFFLFFSSIWVCNFRNNCFTLKRYFDISDVKKNKIKACIACIAYMHLIILPEIY